MYESFISPSRKIPERHLRDVIVRIEQLTGFRRHLGPLSGNEAKTDDAWARQALAIFAYGTNLRPQQMARHLRGQISADQSHSITEICEALGISRATLYRYVKGAEPLTY